MNDHELSTALGAFHAERTQVPDPPTLHERVAALPFDDIPRQRSWLPQSPKWRFQPVFSATKFVVAGVIVALFGGFLLSGVFTQQPSEESLPGLSATTSASAMPEPDATRVEVRDVGSEALVIDVIDLPPAASSGGRLLSTPDAVWLVGENTATRIDKESLEVTDVVPVGGSARTAVIADGSLWQKQGVGKNVRLVETDLSNGEIRNEYRMPASVNDYPDLSTKAGLGWYWSTVIDGAIWGWGFHDRLIRFDLAEREFATVLEPRKERPLRTSKAYNLGYCCVAIGDSIWLTNPDINPKHQDLSIRIFDVTTLEITDALSVGFAWNPAIAGSSEGVFITEHEEVDGWPLVAIHRIDPVVRTITKVIDVSPDAADVHGPGVYMEGGIWVTNESDGTVSRIDVLRGAITHSVELGTRAAGAPLAFDDAIWVPNGDRTVTRIATVAATE